MQALPQLGSSLTATPRADAAWSVLFGPGSGISARGILLRWCLHWSKRTTDSGQPLRGVVRSCASASAAPTQVSAGGPAAGSAAPGPPQATPRPTGAAQGAGTTDERPRSHRLRDGRCRRCCGRRQRCGLLDLEVAWRRGARRAPGPRAEPRRRRKAVAAFQSSSAPRCGCACGCRLI